MENLLSRPPFQMSIRCTSATILMHDHSMAMAYRRMCKVMNLEYGTRQEIFIPSLIQF